MTHIEPFLACRGPVLTPGQSVLLLSVIGGWVISGVLLFVNLALIALYCTTRRPRVINYTWVAFYLLPGCGLFLGAFGNLSSWIILVPIFGVPVLAIGHFVYLLWWRKKGRFPPADAEKQ